MNQDATKEPAYGSVDITLEKTSIRISVFRMIQRSGSMFITSDDLEGERKDDKIVGTSKKGKSTSEFLARDKTLTNVHCLTKLNIIYDLEICPKQKSK